MKRRFEVAIGWGVQPRGGSLRSGARRACARSPCVCGISPAASLATVTPTATMRAQPM